MLTRFHKILLGLLALQIVLVAVTFLRGGKPELAKDKPLFTGLDAAKVTRVRLFASGAEKPGVDLVKKGADWVVASHSDYPADAAKVKGLIEPLAKIAASDPIATSPARHKQLRVADRDFDRKIVLDVEGAGEKTLVIGNPVGSRRTAIRIGGDAVYAATDVSFFVAEPAGFVSTKYVDIPVAEVERLAIQRDQHMIEIWRSFPPAPAPGAGAAGAGSGSAGSAAAPPAPAPAPLGDVTAGAGSGSAGGATALPPWNVAIDGTPVKLAPGESLDTEEIDRIVGQAASIELRAPADPKRDATKPTATLTIHRKGAEQPVVLTVVADGDTTYWVHQQGHKHAIVVNQGVIIGAVTADRDKLVKKPPAPAPEAGSGAAPGSGAADGPALAPGGPLGLPVPAPAAPAPKPAGPAAAPKPAGPAAAPAPKPAAPAPAPTPAAPAPTPAAPAPAPAPTR
ncbi:MAG TPA: DUF4340 domain-containing protein [Kofleriaceae bacterium]|nr:DUF4340 domain-containing protein [Kofleriaceae bacterium]